MTIDRDTHALPPNFTVFATQNPIEYEGTYPLPEAQKDRFMLKITMKAPDRDEELTLAQRTMTKEAPETLLASGAVQPVIKAEDLQALREQLGARSSCATNWSATWWTSSAPRARTRACWSAPGRAPRNRCSWPRAPTPRMSGRDFVTPDDIKAMAVPVLEHRLILRPEFEIEGLDACPKSMQQILQQIAVPR